MKKIMLLLALLIGLTGCASVTPQGAKVRSTRESADVTGCKPLGFVEAQPPFIGPNDAMNEMKDKTAILGGNVLLVTRMSIGPAKGVAYLCPDPATAVKP
jgi:hypothetical protein